jgi:hypothetical protein
MDTKTFLREKLRKLERDAMQFANTSEPMLMMTRNCTFVNGQVSVLATLFVTLFITAPYTMNAFYAAYQTVKDNPLTDEEREAFLDGLAVYDNDVRNSNDTEDES